MMHKNPLYRKVNKKALHFRPMGPVGGHYRHQRNTKLDNYSNSGRGKMHSGKKRGLDYTPLFKFLLSKVGEKWGKVYSEAVSRLDCPDPIFWMVARSGIEKQSYVRVGDNSYYSGLYVDDANCMQLVDPDFDPSDLIKYVWCQCCTYSFNGVPFANI